MDTFTRQYIDTACWISGDDRGLDSDRLAPETLAAMIADCMRFQADNAGQLEDMDSAQAGHDFWLTRCHHGSGFWSRNYPEEQADALTEASIACGERTLYTGDDELIYQEEG